MDQMHEIDLELNDLRKTYLLPAPLLHRRGQGKPKIKQALLGCRSPSARVCMAFWDRTARAKAR